MRLYETRIKSISFLPIKDHSYAQAPYQAITQEAYEQAVAKLKHLDFSAINTDEAQDMYCDGDKCEIILPEHLPEQQEVEFERPVEAKPNRSREVSTPSR